MFIEAYNLNYLKAIHLRIIRLSKAFQRAFPERLLIVVQQLIDISRQLVEMRLVPQVLRDGFHGRRVQSVHPHLHPVL